MKTIKVTINNTTKFRVKASSKNAKDIRVTCPPALIQDVSTLFTDPENVQLDDQNVDFLSGLCNKYEKVLNLKPVFLKRVTDLQTNIRDIELQQKSDDAPSTTEEIATTNILEITSTSPPPTEPVSEESISLENADTSSSASNEIASSDKDNADQILDMISQEPPQLQRNEDVMTISQDDFTTSSIPELLPETAGSVSLETVELECSPNPGERNSVQDADTSFIVTHEKTSSQLQFSPLAENKLAAKTSDEFARQITDISSHETRSLNISKENENTIKIKETRERVVKITTTNFEDDPNLFVKIVSPRHRIVTRYKSYSPIIIPSPSRDIDMDPLIMVS